MELKFIKLKQNTGGVSFLKPALMKKGGEQMLDKVFTNNQVTIAGEVVSEFAFSHEVYGEHFLYAGNPIFGFASFSRHTVVSGCQETIASAAPDVCAAFRGAHSFRTVCVSGRDRQKF